MRIAEVIGRITLSQCHPMVRGGTWLIGVPLSAAAIQGSETGRGDPFIIYDELGASPGALIAVSEGGEAAAPFNPNPKPIDGYNAAILDTVHIEPVS
jgi:ethanolamine utilization protein EutN